MHIIAAFIGLMIFVFFNLYFRIFLVDLNPSSQQPFAASDNFNGLLKLCVKLILPMYYVFDKKLTHTNTFMVVTMLGQLIILFYRFRTK